MRPFKAYLQKILGRSGIYQRLKASRLYDVYWHIVNRKIIDERDNEVKFYRDLLQGFREGDLIYDIGANHGYKTDIFLRLGARIIAVEPDQVNQEILQQKFLSYRFHKMPVVVVDKAVSNRNSIQTMWVDEPGSAKNTMSQKWVQILRTDVKRFGGNLAFTQRKEIQTITLADLIATYGEPFFIKIDVEGHEANVLQSLPRPVPYVSFEVNLPEFKEEGTQCIKLLEDVVKNVEFNYAANLSTGLSLERWTRVAEFLAVFNQCRDESIEIFCRMVAPRAGRIADDPENLAELGL